MSALPVLSGRHILKALGSLFWPVARQIKQLSYRLTVGPHHPLLLTSSMIHFREEVWQPLISPRIEVNAVLAGYDVPWVHSIEDPSAAYPLVLDSFWPPPSAVWPPPHFWFFRTSKFADELFLPK